MSAFTERELLDRVLVRHGTTAQTGFRYARAEHVKLTTGFDSRRVCDAMVMDLWSGYGKDAGPKLHGFEVKTSRADWLTELRNPEKAESFKQYCDYWWLVAADKAIVRDDLPDDWGLLVPSGKGLRAVVVAPRLNPLPLPRQLQATLLRSAVKTTTRLADRSQRDPAIEFIRAHRRGEE